MLSIPLVTLGTTLYQCFIYYACVGQSTDLSFLFFNISGPFCACERQTLFFTHERLGLSIKTFSVVIVFSASLLFLCFSLSLSGAHCLLSSSRVQQQICVSADGHPS